MSFREELATTDIEVRSLHICLLIRITSIVLDQLM